MSIETPSLINRSAFPAIVRSSKSPSVSAAAQRRAVLITHAPRPPANTNLAASRHLTPEHDTFHPPPEPPSPSTTHRTHPSLAGARPVPAPTASDRPTLVASDNIADECNLTSTRWLATTTPAPPRRLKVLAGIVESASNLRRKLQVAIPIGDVSGRRETDCQPTPGRSVKAVEHLLWVSSDHPTQADELLRRGCGRSFVEGALTRGWRCLPICHPFRAYQRVPRITGFNRPPRQPPENNP